MFIEQRTYTLRPGKLGRFWELQRERGFDPVRPILERLVGYFGKTGEEYDQVVHLYRYDSHDDWIARLHGLYGKPELDTYFREVRKLMLRQHNTVLAPAPSRSLTPLIGNGNDWLPGDGPRFARGQDMPAVEIETVDFLPGTLPGFWAALDAQEGDPAGAGLLGGFVTVIGRQHRIVVYRSTHGGGADARWRDHLDRHRGMIASRTAGIYACAPFPVLAPLFDLPDAGSRQPAGPRQGTE